MLSKKFRFHSRGGVRYTYQHGKTIRKPKISLVHCENERGRQRFAVVVSKKVAKSAVVRNRIRRRVYEAVRLSRAEIDFVAKKDNIFVIFSRDIEKMPFKDLKNVITSLLKESMI
jgi:ribonuclease P protein component